ncbi:MAG: OmpA family protein [Gemmatimonadetes bacterium]|nr:OmpA family protein [Gemmatimonadota bacterium]
MLPGTGVSAMSHLTYLRGVAMTMMKHATAAALVLFSLTACATKGFVRRELDSGITAERTQRTSADSVINTELAAQGAKVTGLASELATLKTDVAALRRDLTTLRTEFGAKITAMENGMKFAFPVTFGFDDATVRDEDRASLDRFVQVVNKYYGGSLVTVEGFADPAGSPRYNLQLSQRRAESVSAYLAQAGITGVSMRAIGMGEVRQVVEGAERDMPGAQANRRVVFVVETKGANSAVVSSIQ